MKWFEMKSCIILGKFNTLGPISKRKSIWFSWKPFSSFSNRERCTQHPHSSKNFFVLKSESKKIGHLFCSITQILSILELENINKGQNSLFLTLKWGIARLCRSNSFRDTAINVKTLDFYFFSFCKIWLIFYTKSWKFHINKLFLLVISLEPFEVERRTIPHFKAWNKLFWPLFIQKYFEGSYYQIISKRMCLIFFTQTLTWHRRKLWLRLIRYNPS